MVDGCKLYTLSLCFCLSVSVSLSLSFSLSLFLSLSVCLSVCLSLSLSLPLSLLVAYCHLWEFRVVLPVCAVFSYVRTIVWLTMLGIYNAHTDVDSCDCTRGCTDTVRESALKVESEGVGGGGGRHNTSIPTTQLETCENKALEKHCRT